VVPKSTPPPRPHSVPRLPRLRKPLARAKALTRAPVSSYRPFCPVEHAAIKGTPTICPSPRRPISTSDKCRRRHSLIFLPRLIVTKPTFPTEPPCPGEALEATGPTLPSPMRRHTRVVPLLRSCFGELACRMVPFLLFESQRIPNLHSTVQDPTGALLDHAAGELPLSVTTLAQGNLGLPIFLGTLVVARGNSPWRQPHQICAMDSSPTVSRAPRARHAKSALAARGYGPWARLAPSGHARPGRRCGVAKLGRPHEFSPWPGFKLKSFFHFLFNSDSIQTLKIHIFLNIDPKFMKLILLGF
jgi:hypothetical protein